MLSKKLKLKEGTEIIALHAPADYKKIMGTLPKGVSIKNKISGKHDFIHLFVKNKAELEKEIFKTIKALTPGGIIWISYPKISSKMQTDLTRDKGWESLAKIQMQWLSLISFDENWSAFSMRNELPKEQSKASKEYHDLVEKYVDTKTKTVSVPEDLQSALNKNKKANTFFNTLIFSEKKEYVIWILSAKQEATRKERIKKTIEKLSEGKKNPTEK
jgi:hypothetical protein